MDIISRIRRFQGAVFIAFIAVAISVGWTVVPLLYDLANPVDDTDAGPDQRSGLRLHTDHATGVQYLSSARGGVTPRLKPDGTLFVINPKDQRP